MYAGSRLRRRGSRADYWPGFVDLMSTLLLVMIFLLVVYMLAQYFLQRTLSQDKDRLGELSAQLSSLGEMLALEQQANADLRINIAQLSDQLQASLSERDRLGGQLSLVSGERDTLRLRLREMTGEGQTAMAAAAAAAQAEAAAALRVEASEEKITILLADIERLRRDIDALQAVRTELELRVVTLAAALTESRDELASSQDELGKRQIALDETQAELALMLIALEKSRDELSLSQADLDMSRDAHNLSQAELDEKRAELALMLLALQQNRDELDKRVDELSNSRAALDTSRAEIARLVATLTALRDTTAELEERLSDERERTALSQRTLEERELRLAEVQALHLAAQASLSDSESALSENRTLSARQRDQIAVLNQQIVALRLQLGRLEQALQVSERKSEEQQVTIANLGQRLNMALAAKVEELAAYRSEFFGRLREVLSDRRDFTIIGDRFVFQSEVLFASASDELGAEGQDRLAKFAGILREVMVRIPGDLPWILQVDGHTDSRPIQTARFPSNWELSAARAISVVNFLIDWGIPPEHLSATGYGEFQPIDARDDEIAHRRNRRIELKLTQR